jgi:hypothetical protein
MPALSPYCRPSTLAKLDQRTREARLLRQVTADLTAHVGTPSTTQRMMITRAAQLSMQIALMDAKHAKGGITEHDSRTYLAWVGSLTRLLVQLGLDRPPTRPLTGDEAMAAIRAAHSLQGH